jgi:hypothetical protein
VQQQVQQPDRAGPSRYAPSEPSTCVNDSHRRACISMACKRSGVRLPLAPPSTHPRQGGPPGHSRRRRGAPPPLRCHSPSGGANTGRAGATCEPWGPPLTYGSHLKFTRIGTRRPRCEIVPGRARTRQEHLRRRACARSSTLDRTCPRVPGQWQLSGQGRLGTGLTLKRKDSAESPC